MAANEILSEEYIQDAFHSYLKSSLTQAKSERLLDEELLSSAEGDLMITGPALCLYFAALRCTTNPPSVPLPRQTKTSQPMELSTSNCPPTFKSFLRVWALNVPTIQSLRPEHQHDLARIICNLEPTSQPLQPGLNRVAAELRGVAIEISQRRSFQDRYAGDLQAAIDSGQPPGSPGKGVKASFVPPPVYDPSPTSSAGSSPQYKPSPLPPQSPPASPRYNTQNLPPPSPLSPSRSTFPSSPSGNHLTVPGRRTPSPSLITPDSPAIELIRETLYASLADVLDRTPALRKLLKTDPTRAYFASVAMAILEVATTSITAEGSVVGVLGKELTLAECPPELRPLMSELAAIGRLAHELENEDTEMAMKYASQGRDIPIPRMERIQGMLIEGVGYVNNDGDSGSESGHSSSHGSVSGRTSQERRDGRSSVQGRAMAFANRINALALGMTKLKAFRQRQRDVFKVLAGIGA